MAKSTIKMYVALLRGINVGGNARVEMSHLRLMFESLGFEKVVTYINSGNVIFASDQQDLQHIAETIQKAMHSEFGLLVPVLIKSSKELQNIVHTIPSSWRNNNEMKTDVMFLWEAIDRASIVDDLSVNPQIEIIQYVPGALLWSIGRQDITKSKITKLVGTRLYAQMTVRNVNTVRKLEQLLGELEA